MSYDANGNQTLKDEGAGVLTSYTWDEENRLTNIAYPTGARSTYVYSADGLRRKREESGVSLLEVWDGTQLLQEKDSTTKAEVTRYLLQNDSYSGLRAQRLASDNTWRFFATDVQGSTRMLLNSDGTSNLDLLYRAFGQKQASSGAGSTLMQFGAFYGYEWDADSRMWVKARHLSGTQGRWLSQDPIGFAGGDWNLWRYVGNNPIRDVDPGGLLSPCPRGQFQDGTRLYPNRPGVSPPTYEGPNCVAIPQGIRGLCFGLRFAEEQEYGSNTINACQKANTQCGTKFDCNSKMFCPAPKPSLPPKPVPTCPSIPPYLSGRYLSFCKGLTGWRLFLCKKGVDRTCGTAEGQGFCCQADLHVCNQTCQQFFGETLESQCLDECQAQCHVNYLRCELPIK